MCRFSQQTIVLYIVTEIPSSGTFRCIVDQNSIEQSLPSNSLKKIIFLNHFFYFQSKDFTHFLSIFGEIFVQNHLKCLNRNATSQRITTKSRTVLTRFD